MPDPLTFEDRLAAAVGSLADRMPTHVDALELVRATRAVPARRWISVPSFRFASVTVLVLIALALLAAALVVVALSQGPPRNRFVPTGSMHHAGGTTAAVLSDGRVVIVGSLPDGDGEIARDSRHWVEVFDPTRGEFTEAAELPPVNRFTLTALQDGRALLAGAGDGTGSLGRIPANDASMVFDPGNGTIVETQLTVPRSDQVAALLHDGRVLLAGGFGSKPTGQLGSIASAKIWDPRTGTAVPTGSMIHDRVAAQAVTLPDGRVLILGGQTWTVTDTRASSDAARLPPEIYDPRTGLFRFLAPDPAADPQPLFVVERALDDRLDRIDLVAGTVTDITPYPDLRDLQVAEATGSIGPGNTDCAPGGRPCRVSYTLVPIDARHVLIAGGRPVTRTPGGELIDLPTVAPDEILDPTTGTLAPAGSVLVPRTSPKAVLLPDGRVLLFGGDDLERTAEIYEP